MRGDYIRRPHSAVAECRNYFSSDENSTIVSFVFFADLLFFIRTESDVAAVELVRAMSRRVVPSKAKSSESARQSQPPPPPPPPQQQQQQQQRARQKPKSRNAETFDTGSVVEEELPDAELLQKLRQNMRGHDEVESTFADAIDAIEEK